MEVDLDQLRELMKAMDDHGMSELELERGEERIVLRRGSAAAIPMPMMTQAPSFAPPPASAAPAAEEAEVEGEYVTSPFVGTFYRAPNPTSKAFVNEGSSFEAGQTLCIVEAMKLMNEIEAEFSGKILEILVENGKPVEYGDRLFRVQR
ncbi:MAG: acetyl-CoA carboxylase, biotin carboxyl carrier protein [Sandaracinus sp.]|nr:acetyl-CoA carboxylase, biotin carboxyl carrier protein [Sandaracinus sp.]